MDISKLTREFDHQDIATCFEIQTPPACASIKECLGKLFVTYRLHWDGAPAEVLTHEYLRTNGVADDVRELDQSRWFVIAFFEVFCVPP